jgi:two-component system, sensor histidine kinase and response regulator
LRVLLAEDNLINRKLMHALLRRRGCAVATAENGEQALALYDRQAYDLILMDVQMPRLDGLMATAQIRDREKSSDRHVPIIAMTANALQGDREQCLAAGMDDYLSKPIQHEELNALLDRYARSLPSAAVAAGAESPAELRSTPPAPVCGAQAPIWDEGAALARLDGDRDLLLSLLQRFSEQAAQETRELKSLLEQRDYAGVGNLAHTLKGTAANLSCERLRARAYQLEQLARQSAPWEELENAWQELAEDTEDLIDHLRGVMHS